MIATYNMLLFHLGNFILLHIYNILGHGAYLFIVCILQDIPGHIHSHLMMHNHALCKGLVQTVNI